MKNNTVIVILVVSFCLTAFTIGMNAGSKHSLDLFSIVSFGLAITALVLSILMAWLSWEFYKKATDATNEIKSTTIKIESLVGSIKSDITEIVKRAVSHWTDGGVEAEADERGAELSKQMGELRAQIESSAQKKDIDAKLAEIQALYNDQLSRYERSIVDARARAIFPSLERSPAVGLDQQEAVNDDDHKEGKLVISVLRPVQIATATGRFTPAFKRIPGLEVRLDSAPTSNTSEIVITSGVGKLFNFNVHLRAKNGPLPAGQYVVSYKASVAEHEPA